MVRLISAQSCTLISHTHSRYADHITLYALCIQYVIITVAVVFILD